MAAGPQLSARYEQLREQVLTGRGGGLGLALFLRQGIMAWLSAWSECTRAAPEARPEPPVGEMVPAGSQAEIVLVLASMALQQRRKHAE